MSYELIRMRPSPSRTNDKEVLALIKKSTKRVKDKDADLTLYRVQVYFVDTVEKMSGSYQVIKYPSSPKFDLIADHKERSVGFSFGEMGELLPKELRGGGVGSFALSELIQWAKARVPEYGVKPVKVFSPPDEGGEALARNQSFLKKSGFALQQASEVSGGGVFGLANGLGQLKKHVNLNKIDPMELPGWFSNLAVARAEMNNKMEEEINRTAFYKEELAKTKDSGKSKLSFWSGIYMGLAVATVLALSFSFL